MNNAANVTAGKPKIGGAISRAPVGTTLPTDATSDLDNAFVSLGYISEDGLSNDSAIVSESIKAWGGDNVLDVQTDRSDRFSFTSIEALNVEVLKMFFGKDNVTGSLATGITVKANTQELGEYSYVIDMILKGGVLKRVVISNGKIVETGEVVYKNNEPVGYPFTIAGHPDSAGNTHYEYIKSAASSTTGGNT